ncbi:DMT family transporter [Mesorhizobium sp. M0028]|uniref:DMT family transporter n=1 Tax=Mesorhizobium sp. M0028 TaxID=2956849 RepID=UPI0033358C42
MMGGLSISHKAVAAILMAMSVFMFSATEVFIKALGSSYSLFQIIAFRIWLSLPIILTVLYADRRNMRFRTSFLLLHALRFLFGLTSMIAIFYVVTTIPLGTAAALTSTAPFFVLVGSSFFLAERVTKFGWLGAAVGFLGVILVAAPYSTSNLAGAFVALAGALLTGGVTICLRILGRTEHPAISALYNTTGMSFVCLVATAYFGFPSFSVEDYLLVAGLGTAGGLAQILNAWAYCRGNAAALAPLEFTACLWGPLFGLAIWDEAMTPIAIVGLAAIVVGGCLCTTKGVADER